MDRKDPNEPNANLILYLIAAAAVFAVIFALAIAVVNRYFPYLLQSSSASTAPQVQYYAPPNTTLSPDAQTQSPTLPPGDTVHIDYHYYILCKEENPTCRIGRWLENLGLFRTTGDEYVDPSTVLSYHMILPPFTEGSEYSMCEMDESVIWVKSPGDEFADELIGCIHVRFDTINGNYYWFTVMDENPANGLVKDQVIFVPYASYNLFPWVRPIDR